MGTCVRSLSVEDPELTTRARPRAKSVKQVGFEEAPAILQKAQAAKLPQGSKGSTSMTWLDNEIYLKSGQPLQASAKSTAMPAKRPAMPKRAPACGSVTCTRVGVCLCDDRPPLVHSQPSQR